jgi:hypothetical protein
MLPLRVVIDTNVLVSDELFYVRSQMIQIIGLVGVDFLSLQCLHEALAARAVIRICWPAHARNHAVLIQDRHVFRAGILETAI